MELGGCGGKGEDRIGLHDGEFVVDLDLSCSNSCLYIIVFVEVGSAKAVSLQVFDDKSS